ncbi:pyrophosphate-dependent phosphofructokinase [Tribonema minus]|uniref:Pyrophosphate-dependent phosphofructokinase n=1 Tax=Tribonema minus TaxID=303371 RepID=A0A836C7Q7_9STRA|nr:pyrophosphate-dependent phosphofructokinase [Tribonema minus]
MIRHCSIIDRYAFDKVYMCEVPNLNEAFPPCNMRNDCMTQQSTGEPSLWNRLLGPRDCILLEHVCGPGKARKLKALLRAGPRPLLHFPPKETVAAIVTCGGLCPGLNSVIHYVTETLLQNYGARRVIGIKGGFGGFYDADLEPLELTMDAVNGLQNQGGTLLGSSRGGFDLDKILLFLQKHEVTHLYVIGGDGTHRGADKIAHACLERKLNIAVAGIPKTIDNDVDLLDRSFGFTTSVEAAQNAIKVAVTEATCNLPNGIGIVKLMGRSSGFIAAYATMASGEVDLCLVPEAPIVLEGDKGCLPHLERVVADKGYAVVVVAEGAGEELLGASAETDASGNKKLPKIGEFMQAKIEEYFAKQGKQCSPKYIDPSYMVRSVPANASDQILCMQLAQNAVHAAMAGYTSFTVGMVNNKVVLIPISLITATSPRKLDPYGRTWERIISITLQPNTVPFRPVKGAAPREPEH